MSELDEGQNPAVDLDLRDLTADDVDCLQQLLESVPEYAERITGYPPGPTDALSTLIGTPPDFDIRGKRGLGLWDGSRLVAFIDVLLGYPDPRTAYVGLLVVHGACQRRGLGRHLHRSLLNALQQEGSIERLRVGIISRDEGASEPFWIAMGYAATGEERPYNYDKVTGTVALWERPLDASGRRSDGA
jgi:GNAT superfamily N-acetyltransferase